MIRFEVYRDVINQFRWRLVAANNKIVATSEGYSTRLVATSSANQMKAWVSQAIVHQINN